MRPIISERAKCLTTSRQQPCPRYFNASRCIEKRKESNGREKTLIPINGERIGLRYLKSVLPVSRTTDTNAPAATPSRRIAAVSDDPSIRRLLRFTFDGYRILDASSSDNALELLSGKPALAVVDLDFEISRAMISCSCFESATSSFQLLRFPAELTRETSRRRLTPAPMSI